MGEILDAHMSVQRKSESRCLLVSMLKATGVTKYIIPKPIRSGLIKSNTSPLRAIASY